MIKLYKDQKISIYKIQKELGLPINSPFLYNYAKGKRSIKNMDIDKNKIESLSQAILSQIQCLSLLSM